MNTTWISHAQARSAKSKRRGTHTEARRAQRETDGSHAEARGAQKGKPGTVAAIGGAGELGRVLAGQPNLPLSSPHLRSSPFLRCGDRRPWLKNGLQLNPPTFQNTAPAPGTNRPWFKIGLQPIPAVQPNLTGESRGEAQSSHRMRRGTHTEALRARRGEDGSHAEARGAQRGKPGTVAAIGGAGELGGVSAGQPNLPPSSPPLRSSPFLRCGASRSWFKNELQPNPPSLQPNLPLSGPPLRSPSFLRCGERRPWFENQLPPNVPLASPLLRSSPFLRCGASRPWFKNELPLNPLPPQPNPPAPRPLPRARDCSGKPTAPTGARTWNEKPGWRSQGPYLPLTEAQ